MVERFITTVKDHIDPTQYPKKIVKIRSDSSSLIHRPICYFTITSLLGVLILHSGWRTIRGCIPQTVAGKTSTARAFHTTLQLLLIGAGTQAM